MSELCARPGCGHIYLGHDDERETGRPATGHAVVGCLECECAQYRTAEQQEAWRSANASLAAWTDPEVGEYVGACTMEDALVGLLKAYP